MSGGRPAAAHDCRWLHDADAAYAAMEALADGATATLDAEFYIFSRGVVGARLLAALVRAARRGVRVRLLLDAYGSEGPGQAWLDELAAAGGELRWFNPRRLLRYACRDHRKLVVADGARAVLGGFNVGDEYAGDGVASGWRDLGLWVEGPVAAALAASFDALHASAPLRRRDWPRLLRALRQPAPPGDAIQLLLSGPGHSQSQLRRALRADLARARSVDVLAAYFVPTAGVRRQLRRAARRGRVRLLTAGRSDVPLVQMACRSLYPAMLRAGVEVWEYQPQVLHAKALRVDDVVYVGSANLDARSLQLNFELMLRIADPRLAAQLGARFEDDLARSARVQAESLARRGLLERAAQWLARMMVARLDPWLALAALRRWL